MNRPEYMTPALAAALRVSIEAELQAAAVAEYKLDIPPPAWMVEAAVRGVVRAIEAAAAPAEEAIRD